MGEFVLGVLGNDPYVVKKKDTGLLKHVVSVVSLLLLGGRVTYEVLDGDQRSQNDPLALPPKVAEKRAGDGGGGGDDEVEEEEVSRLDVAEVVVEGEGAVGRAVHMPSLPSSAVG